MLTRSATRSSRILAIAGVIGVALPLGCGGDVRYVPASGVVTLDGKPLDRAEVVLSYDASALPAGPAPTTRGVSDAEGRFVLHSLTSEKQLVDGAIPGAHRVALTTRIVEEDKSGKTVVVRNELLDYEYTSGRKLTVDIPPRGTKELRLEVSSHQERPGRP